MRKLYDILTETLSLSRHSLAEGILDDDEDIVRSTELHTRYEVFLQYFGDILWKKSQYSYSSGAGTIVFEFDRPIQIGTAEQMYKEVDARLNRYFKHLERTYAKTYQVSWRKKYAMSSVVYYLNMKEGSKNNIIEFCVRNISCNRRIDIVWPKNFVFMSPDISEGILDTDDDITSGASGDIIINQLVDNGIFYACVKTKARFASACENEIASYKNDVLSFINDKIKLSSEVTIDYSKAKSFLSKHHIKSIEAPIVSIFNIDGDDYSFLGHIKTRQMKIHEPAGSIKNLHVSPCSTVPFTVIKNGDIRYRYGGADFCDSIADLTSEYTFIKVETYREIEFVNSIIDVNQVTISGEDVKFKNCSGDLRNIELYDPSLFDGMLGKRIFQLFDPSHRFNHYINANMKKERSTNSLRKILAYFNNKKFFAPDDTPYKIVGSLKNIIDVSKFKDFYSMMLKDNNITIYITPDLDRARRVQNMERLHYSNNNWQAHQVEQTKDGYYVIVYKN